MKTICANRHFWAVGYYYCASLPHFESTAAASLAVALAEPPPTLGCVKHKHVEIYRLEPLHRSIGSGVGELLIVGRTFSADMMENYNS